MMLIKSTIGVPILPPKSLLSLNQADLEKLRTDLEKYLRPLVLRKDIMNIK
jgi:hypothetical protein